MYDAGGALAAVYKVHDQELVERISLQNGHPLAKWTGSTLTYLHADHLGTPIRGTHGLGAGTTPGAEVFQDFSTPYGLNPTPGWHGSTGSGFDPATGQGSNCGVTGFATHVKDCESGLTYMQARSYDPVVGRFLSIDRVDFMSSGGNPGYFNRYAYTMNDPINNFDPDGRECVTQNTTTCGTSASASGAVGAASYAAQNTTRSNQVRTQYNNAASQFSPNDSAGRSALKQSTRAATPAPQRAIINATRPSTGAQVGTSGNATHTNARTNSAAKALGTVGKASGALAIATGGAQIALSDDKSRTTASVAGSAVGGVAGGIAGAEAGAVVGGGIGLFFGGAGAAPGAAIGAVVGGIGGSVGGGIAGGNAGEKIHDELAGP